MSAEHHPLPGMTIHPDPCGGCEPALDWPGFRGCVHWAASNESMRTQFAKDTGIDALRAGGLTAEERAELQAKFADWVAVNVWGVGEGAP